MPKLLDTTKPFATGFFAADTQAEASNPNGWQVHTPGYDVAADPADFRSKMLNHATQIKNNSLTMGADVVYTWDFPFGQRFPHVFTYFGDPTVWQILCPELTTVTAGKTLLAEILEVFTNAGLKVAWTLRPQRVAVQTSGPLPTDTTIDWVLRLDQPWGSQLYHWTGSAWVVATPSNQGGTGYGQYQPYGTSYAEGELTRKLNYIAANFPQITHFYIDTTVDPAGTPFGTLDQTFWKRLKTAFPNFIFSQEQEDIVDSVYFSGDTPSSAAYGQSNLWDSNPPIRETDMRPNAQRLISLASTNQGDSNRYSVMRPWLIEAVARGWTKIGGRPEFDPSDVNGDTYIINDILTAAATWTPPAPNPWTTVSTNDLSAWTFEGYQGSGYVDAPSRGSIVSGKLRVTSVDGFNWSRGWRRLGDLTPGQQRVLNFTVANVGAPPLVSLRKADGTIVYSSGDVASGTYQATITVPAGTNALYLYFAADDYNGSADLSNVSFAVATTTDTTPDAFSFTDVTGAAVSTLYTSNVITVAGINAPSAISITGGEYSINGGAWVTAPGTVNNGNTVQVRGTSPSSGGATTNVVLTIGGVSDTYSITTASSVAAVYSQNFDSVTIANLLAGADGGAWNFRSFSEDGGTVTVYTDPNDPNLPSIVAITGGKLVFQGGVGGKEWPDGNVIITGLTAGVAYPISIALGDAGPAFVRVRNQPDTGSPIFESTNIATPATINSTFTPAGTSVRLSFGVWDFGDVSVDNIVIGTASAPPDTTPDAFAFTDVTGAARSTLYTSNQITVAGINAAAAISVTGGEYQINGGAWTSSPGTVSNGNTVQVRGTSSSAYSTAVPVSLTIGGVSDTYTITTLADPASSGGGVIYSENFDSHTLADLLAGGANFSWIFKDFGDVTHTYTDASNPALANIVSIAGGKLVFEGNVSNQQWPQAEVVITGLTAGVQYPISIDLSNFGPGYLRVRNEPHTGTNLYTADNVASPASISGSFTPAGTSVRVIFGVWDYPDVSFDNLLIGTNPAGSDTTPNAFSFAGVSNAARSTQYTSLPITVSGINAAAPISVSGGQYRVNGGAWVSGTSAVNNGDTVEARGTSSSSYSTAVGVVVTIGGVAGTYSITTGAAPTTLKAGPIPTSAGARSKTTGRQRNFR